MENLPALRFYRKKEASPPSVLMQGGVTEVVVGEEPRQKIYQIHTALLCHYSEGLEERLRSQALKGDAQHIDLEKESIDIFDQVQFWLYDGKFNIEILEPVNEATMVKLDYILVNIWLFGDRFVMPALQNAALDILNHLHICNAKFSGFAGVILAKELYLRAPLESGARTWVVHMFAQTQDLSQVNNLDRQVLGIQFWFEVASITQKWLHRRVTEDEEFFAPRGMCRFHEHPHGLDCAALRERDDALRKTTRLSLRERFIISRYESQVRQPRVYSDVDSVDIAAQHPALAQQRSLLTNEGGQDNSGPGEGSGGSDVPEVTVTPPE
ncbi:MAG: hypothetical protein Q9162_005623 [Coniocarpon cinnabarinum]